MLAMDMQHHIRRLFYEQGLNLSQIARETGRDWKTVKKYVDKVDFNDPDPMPAPRCLCPKLDPYKSLIDQWLMEDKNAPRKQRHTAKRVYKRLEDETEGFDCSYSLVAEYVKAKKEELNLRRTEGFLPLVHFPGESQGDFGAADFFENGIRYSGKYFALDFPFSNCGYIQLHYGENMECLLESMVAIFEHVGGVPTEIWFDNTKTIVTKVIRGGGREVTDRFLRFQEHYGFKAVFMNPDSGNEKGGVENKVGYSRRNLLVPVPRFIRLSDYNRQLLELCDKDADREHYRFPGQTIQDRFETDRKAFLPLSDRPFDTAAYIPVHTDLYGKFRLSKGTHVYSSSPGCADQDIWAKLTAEHVYVLDQGQKVITVHRRLYGDEYQESMQWLPYLKYIARKPRSLRNSGIYSMMPESMQAYMDGCGNSERGKVLKVLSELTDRTGFDSALKTVEQAILYQAHNGDSLMNLYRRLYADVPPLPPIKGQAGIPELVRMPSGLEEYDTLLGRGCGV